MNKRHKCNHCGEICTGKYCSIHCARTYAALVRWHCSMKTKVKKTNQVKIPTQTFQDKKRQVELEDLFNHEQMKLYNYLLELEKKYYVLQYKLENKLY